MSTDINSDTGLSLGEASGLGPGIRKFATDIFNSPKENKGGGGGSVSITDNPLPPTAEAIEARQEAATRKADEIAKESELDKARRRGAGGRASTLLSSDPLGGGFSLAYKQLLSGG